MTTISIVLSHKGKAYTAEECSVSDPCAGCAFLAGPAKCDLPHTHPGKHKCVQRGIIWTEIKPESDALDSEQDDMRGVARRHLDRAPRSDAHGFLSEAAQTMLERGKQYDQPDGERSFERAAKVFNAITGYEITAADVALVQVCIKLVRSQSRADPHRDSLLDAVAYMSLHAEERMKEAV